MKYLLKDIILRAIYIMLMSRDMFSELLSPMIVLNVHCLCPYRVFSFLVRSRGRAQACCIDGRNPWVTTSQLQGESRMCPRKVVSQCVRSHASHMILMYTLFLSHSADTTAQWRYLIDMDTSAPSSTFQGGFRNSHLLWNSMIVLDFHWTWFISTQTLCGNGLGQGRRHFGSHRS